MKMYVLFLIGLVLASFSESVSKLPEYRVSRAQGPIVIDGQISDSPWAEASVLEFRDNLTGEPAAPRTSARVLYDADFLYFAFESWDTNIWSTYRVRDQHLWTEEVVELFLQPDPGNAHYIELEVNPLGTMLDIYLIDIRKPIPYESWNPPGLSWAVEVDGTVDGAPGDRKWTCEIALPLTEAVTAPRLPPQPGDRWRMNLYRVEQHPEKAALAWSPTLRADFHIPSRFGVLIFEE